MKHLMNTNLHIILPSKVVAGPYPTHLKACKIHRYLGPMLLGHGGHLLCQLWPVQAVSFTMKQLNALVPTAVCACVYVCMWAASVHTCVYIYIYVCVCVCVCEDTCLWTQG